MLALKFPEAPTVKASCGFFVSLMQISIPLPYPALPCPELQRVGCSAQVSSLGRGGKELGLTASPSPADRAVASVWGSRVRGQGGTRGWSYAAHSSAGGELEQDGCCWGWEALAAEGAGFLGGLSLWVPKLLDFITSSIK